MGNISSLARASTALDSYVAELGSDISYEKSLSSSRFLKTILVRHEYGLLVLKLFIKPDPLMALRVIQRRLKNQRDLLQDVPNILSYSTFVETDKAGYLIRQWAGSSLYDRISTRPYLAPIEKKWIAFQILSALRDARSRDVSHGDLKSENILITPSLGVYVTDFASAFKPTFLPLDDPSDFSYYYDSSARRTCYVAPERFYEEGSKVAEVKKAALSLSLVEGGAGTATGLAASNWLMNGVGKKDGKITEEMDVFSAGCVLVEMWTDGAGLFNLSELFAYRGGDSSGMGTILGSIEDGAVRSMVAGMLSLQPQNRPSFDRILEDYRNTVFPDYFYTFLPDYIASLDSYTSPSAKAEDAINPITRLEGHSDAILMQMYKDWPGIISAVLEEHAMSRVREKGAVEAQDGLGAQNDDGPAILLLNLIISNIRNCLRASSKLSALRPIRDLARRLTGEQFSDRVVPYLVSLTKDDLAQVRAASCRLSSELLCGVDSVSTANLELVPEYIIPNIRHLAEDDDIHVRCTYAEALPILAEVALRMLEMGEAMRLRTINSGASYDDWKDPDYDATSSELQSLIEEQAAILLVDTSSEVKRAALTNASKLCRVFGRQKTNDVLLSRMITYLNDQDWRLRHSFLGSIVKIAAFVGSTSLEEFVLPLMEQALADPEDAIVAMVLASLSSIIELGLLTKMRNLEILSCTLGFLCHPNAWIRQGSADLTTKIASQMSPDDRWCMVFPLLRPVLRAEIAAFGSQEILDRLVQPLSRIFLDGARVWAQAAGPKSWWYRKTTQLSRNDSVRSFNAVGLSSVSLASGLSELDTQQLHGLRQRGLSLDDEAKLVLLREHIAMQAAIANRRNLDSTASTADSAAALGAKVALQDYQVMPQTVFLQPFGSQGTALTVRPRRSDRVNSVSTRASLASPIGQRSERMRKHSSENLLQGNDDPLAELRRKLSRLGTEHPEERVPVTIQATDELPPATALSLDYALHTPAAESVASTPMPNHVHKHASSRTGKSRISANSDSSKAAPEISAIRAHAVGRLEMSAELRFPGSASGASPSQDSASEAPADTEEARTKAGFRISYEGQDPGVLAYLGSSVQVGSSPDIYDYGPIIAVVPERKRHMSMRKGSSFIAEESDGLTPVMIADLAQHQCAIQGIAVAPDHAFFVSVDQAGLCLIWDVNRLERTVTTRSRLSYSLDEDRVTFATTLPRSHCFIVGNAAGWVEICRVWTTRQGDSLRFVKVTSVSRYNLSEEDGYATCIATMNDDSHTDLMIGTSKGSILRLDRGTMKPRIRMSTKAPVGRITCLVLDLASAWLCAGTSGGKLMVWDLRYGVLLRDWQCGASISTCTLHPSPTRSKSVILACHAQVGNSSRADVLVQTVELPSGAVIETFLGPDVEMMPKGETTKQGDAERIRDTMEMVSAIAQATLPQIRPPSISRDICSTLALPSQVQSRPTELLSPVGEAFEDGSLTASSPAQTVDGILVLGSEDHIVRWWNLGKPKASSAVSGMGLGGERSYSFQMQRSSGASCYQEKIADHSRRRRSRGKADDEAANSGRAARQPLKPHLNAVTALAVLETPFSSSPVLVTGDRSGAIKVWRIES